MSEKQARASGGGDRPERDAGSVLKEKRDVFLQTFFRRGAELTDELVSENDRLRDRLASLEDQNASLKTHLAGDNAMRDLLTKIHELEAEKSRLLSTVRQQEALTNRVTNRFAEVELELESFASLYVASFQLHASLRAPVVMRNVKELLLQLVGARALAIYFLDEGRKRLVPIATEGVDGSGAPEIGLHEIGAVDPIAAVVERTFLTGVPLVAEGDVTSSPAACIPMRLDDRIVGAIVVYALLDQKRRFAAVDRELFKLLSAHAGGAFIASYSFMKGGNLPSPDALRAMCT